MTETSPDPRDRAIAQFLMTLSTAAAELAAAFTARPMEQPDFRDRLVGSMQRQVAALLDVNGEEGVSPRQITEMLGRTDDGNVRNTLNRLRELGVAELVPGSSWPQMWRPTALYRKDSPEAE
ncbi:hypothetical protein [Actinopolymorpha singaporensis]|uniref:Uncharacterized protein n=1 Tax=Actinopolymorpha singaporensis TaxID=117157 RepID=A0A1H1P9I3_9ACTN|nr:hypothetical protein [Actinopolymorpha singaporensis]SDS07946.1 hypothetical protein SAMN04489717_1552 [Actinopolymorpha singaporensis]